LAQKFNFAPEQGMKPERLTARVFDIEFESLAIHLQDEFDSVASTGFASTAKGDVECDLVGAIAGIGGHHELSAGVVSDPDLNPALADADGRPAPRDIHGG